MIEPPRTPGQWLQELLDERGWTQKILEVVTGLDQASISKIISGKKAVDARIALMFGGVFGVDPERFMALQQSFDLAQAKILQRPDPTMARRAQLYADLPITDMIKRGWLRAKDIRDTVAGG